MSNVIRGDQLAGFRRWQVPQMQASEVKATELADIEQTDIAQIQATLSSANLLTAAEIEAIQRHAYEEAYAVGLAEGHKAGQLEANQQIEHLNALLKVLAQPLEILDKQMEQELVTLVIGVARQLIRRELKTSPGEILAVVRSALAVLPVGQRHVQLHLHPEDAALVRELMAVPEGEAAWRIAEDPMLSRGDCRVTTATSQIDARLETRLGAVISATFGGQRNEDGGIEHAGG